MDPYEATKVVFSRIQKLDPENASKIMGLLLIQEHGEKEMIRLAFGPENLLHSFVAKSRHQLCFSQNSNTTNSTASSSSRFLPNGVTVPPSLTIPSWGASDMTGFAGSNSCASTLNPSTPPFYCSSSKRGGVGLGLEEQLSFLNDSSSSSSPTLRPRSSDMYELLGDGSVGESGMFDRLANAGSDNNMTHRRSYSVSDVNLDDPGSGLGWKPCMYYAKGFCKNGSSCRFVHGNGNDFVDNELGSPSKLEMIEQCHELLRSKSMQHHKLMAAAAMSPYSMNKGLSLFSQHHPQNDSPRAAAAAAALMLGEEIHQLSRSPRGLDNCRPDLNPASRQIYLTFPADSTFREEDVSNYFSIYGPVQDVRIPYQQKRMFGFVTFVYPDTVKIILAKGNPHFVCDSRVLVKPYKEKGKVPDKFRKHQQMDRGEFSSCASPTGVDSRDLFDAPIGGRMMYETQTQYMLWRRKLEEEADLQQALELQSRRLMNLQLLDVKRNHHHRSLSTGSRSIHSPTQSPNSIFHQSLLGSDRSSPDTCDEICVSPPLSEANQALEQAINEIIDREKEGSIGGEDGVNVIANESPCLQDNIFDLPESLDHYLPDSPFASPKKSAKVTSIPTAASTNGYSKVPSFLPSSPTLDMAPFNSCYFQMPRFSPGHGAIGM